MSREETPKPLGAERFDIDPLPPLPRTTRLLLLLLGWTLVLVGLVGLVLPGLQGVLTLLAGAAVLSLVTPRLHQWLERRLHDRPWARKKLSQLRRKIHGWVS